jgi:hypothetical protein
LSSSPLSSQNSPASATSSIDIIPEYRTSLNHLNEIFHVALPSQTGASRPMAPSEGRLQKSRIQTEQDGKSGFHSPANSNFVRKIFRLPLENWRNDRLPNRPRLSASNSASLESRPKLNVSSEGRARPSGPGQGAGNPRQEKCTTESGMKTKPVNFRGKSSNSRSCEGDENVKLERS